jgi:acetylornithine/N-succinyldiaminopimelate aminotransferase
MNMNETDKEIFAEDKQSYLPVFNRYQIVLDHGEGAYAWDVNGKKYIDFLGGIAVNVLGHGYTRRWSRQSRRRLAS